MAERAASLAAMTPLPAGRRAPGGAHVVRVIAQREFALALRRRLLRLFFLGGLLPPVILVVAILVRMMAEQATHLPLRWDPLLHFMNFQALPVMLLALGLGTPSVARDRGEDVLFLYATRPVQPWHYALGKLLAVALPAAALMFEAGGLIPLLRWSFGADLAGRAALAMAAKVLLVSVAMGWALAGLCVSASAAVKRGRWALLIALAGLFLPDAAAQIVGRGEAWPIGPAVLTESLLARLLGDGEVPLPWSLSLMLAWGALGLSAAWLRVKQEMIP